MTVRHEHMNKYHPDIKEFFTNVDIKGTYYQKANTVVTFMRRGNLTPDRYFNILIFLRLKLKIFATYWIG